ncbi:MAG: amidohydrolase family protein [Deferribacteraceae bacterium]|jgi:5-methylthioadenosine/S-adenosylhomocysteine deaminase|nr:amidohydrolase family protein [Deferribacteraceae bacterium]
MKKDAYYADYLWYNSKPVENSWLLVHSGKITGCTAQKPDESYKLHYFDKSAIFPSLINTHTHLPMTFLRGYADDLPLHEWLNKHIWPAEKQWLSAEFVTDFTILSVAELIHSGTSCVNDMYFFTKNMAKVFSNAGLRGTLGCGVLDTPGDKKNQNSLFKNVEKLIEIYKDNPLINIAFCPHAIYTVSPDTYRRVVEFVQKHDLLLHTHLSETEWEVKESFSRYGKRPVELMDSLGVFDCKSVFAHCVHLNDDEIKLMGQKKANVSHCLQSNLKLASGFAPISKLTEAGANVTIGTDGAASNNDQDMISEMNTVALFHKGFMNSPTVFSAEDVFNCATKNAAHALGLTNVGELKNGFQADFMVVSYASAHMQPVYNHLSHLIYSAKKSDVTALYVAGNPLMVNGKLKTINEKKAVKDACGWSEKIKTWRQI